MKRLLTLLFVAALGISPALAGTRVFGVHGVGPRVGVTIDPDQIHFGGHLDLGDLATRLMIFPEVEIGIGDNLTVVAPMFDIAYRFREDWGSWNPYLGAGIGPVFISEDHGGSNSELGMSLQGGLQKRLTSQSGFMFLEFKLNLVDYPDVKFTLGWCFGSK
jgi:opacity protein-like surface antigen